MLRYLLLAKCSFISLFLRLVGFFIDITALELMVKKCYGAQDTWLDRSRLS